MGRRRSGEKLKKVTRKKVVAVVVDQVRDQEATSLKVTWYIVSTSEGRCPGNYTGRGKKVL